MDTECPVCRDAEMTRREKMTAGASGIAVLALSRVSRWLLPEPPAVRVIRAATSSYAAVMSAAIGGVAPEQRAPTWYERHRSAWESTGDVVELERMTRHVEHQNSTQ